MYPHPLVSLHSSPRPWCWENASIISGVLSLEGNSETVLSPLTPFSNCTNEEKRRQVTHPGCHSPRGAEPAFKHSSPASEARPSHHRGLHLSERSVPSLLITSWGFLLPPRSTDLTDSEMPGDLLSSAFHSASELPIWKPGWRVRPRGWLQCCRHHSHMDLADGSTSVCGLLYEAAQKVG